MTRTTQSGGGGAGRRRGGEQGDEKVATALQITQDALEHVISPWVEKRKEKERWVGGERGYVDLVN